MNIRELIKNIKDCKRLKEIELKNRKNNISQNYELAQMDFIVIENIEDTIQVLNILDFEIEQLQERIRERNRKGYIYCTTIEDIKRIDYIKIRE